MPLTEGGGLVALDPMFLLVKADSSNCFNLGQGRLKLPGFIMMQRTWDLLLRTWLAAGSEVVGARVARDYRVASTAKRLQLCSSVR